MVRRHWDLIFRYMRAHLDTPQEAEDATQELFLKLLQRDRWEALDLASPSSERFLFHLAGQLLVDRRRSRRAAKRGGGRRRVTSSLLGLLSTDEGDPDIVLTREWCQGIAEDARRTVERILVSRRQREAALAFQLYYFESGNPVRWTQARIARRLGVPVSRVNSYLHRARRLFRTALWEATTAGSSPGGQEDDLLDLARFLDSHRLYGGDAPYPTSRFRPRRA